MNSWYQLDFAMSFPLARLRGYNKKVIINQPWCLAGSEPVSVTMLAIA